jgi:hypothetical protein
LVVKKLKNYTIGFFFLFSHEFNVWSKYSCNDLKNIYNLKHRYKINRSRIEYLITLKTYGNVRIELCLSETYKKISKNIMTR